VSLEATFFLYFSGLLASDGTSITGPILGSGTGFSSLSVTIGSTSTHSISSGLAGAYSDIFSSAQRACSEPYVRGA